MSERTTVVLPPQLKARAVARARAQGISFGELIRRAVEKEIAPSSKEVSKMPSKRGARKTGDPFWDNLVIYDADGPADLSERHDDYLYGGH